MFDLGQNRVKIDLNCLIPNLLYCGRWWKDNMHISLIAVFFFFLIFRLVIESAVHCGVVTIISFGHAVLLGHGFELVVYLVHSSFSTLCAYSTQR